MNEEIARIHALMGRLKKKLRECEREVEQIQWEVQYARPDKDWGILTFEESGVLHIQKVLALCGGNKMKAARLLKINIKTLYNWLERAERKKMFKERDERPLTPPVLEER